MLEIFNVDEERADLAFEFWKFTSIYNFTLKCWCSKVTSTIIIISPVIWYEVFFHLIKLSIVFNRSLHLDLISWKLSRPPLMVTEFSWYLIFWSHGNRVLYWERGGFSYDSVVQIAPFIIRKISLIFQLHRSVIPRNVLSTYITTQPCIEKIKCTTNGLFW
jgi:hypothetical protein